MTVTLAPVQTRCVPSPVGWLMLVAVADAVTEIRFLDTAPPDRQGHQVSAMLDLLEQQLDDYFAGTRQVFTVPLHPVGTDFQRQAWQVLGTIPFGETITYGEQARRLGRPTAVRAVGSANSRNPLPIVVPCHRVIGAAGALIGFAGGLDRKAWLLDHERRISLADAPAQPARGEPGPRPAAAACVPCAQP